MARQHRFVIPGVAQHVIQRGNNRAAIFSEPADYEMFLCTVAEACAKHQVDLHAYVLMTNHVHFMMTPQSQSALSLTLQGIGRRYVQFFNGRQQRTGGLFEGRYRAWMLDDERYFLTCMRYIELNPVRAGIVTVPDAYRWSSYRAHGLGAANDLLVAHPLYLGLGDTEAARQATWRTQCQVTPSEEPELPAWMTA
jgi:putative transposase